MLAEVQSHTAAGVLEALCGALEQAGRLSDKAVFYKAVMTREELCSTSVAPGWALPHGRVKGLTDLSFAIARTRQPLPWFSASALRPRIIFVFAIPEDQPKAYLHVIAALAKLNQNAGLVERLLAAVDDMAMYEVLKQVPLVPHQSAAAATPTPAALKS